MAPIRLLIKDSSITKFLSFDIMQCTNRMTLLLEQYLSLDISLVAASSGRSMFRSDVNIVNSIPLTSVDLKE